MIWVNQKILWEDWKNRERIKNLNPSVSEQITNFYAIIDPERMSLMKLCNEMSTLFEKTKA